MIEESPLMLERRIEPLMMFERCKSLNKRNKITNALPQMKNIFTHICIYIIDLEYRRAIIILSRYMGCQYCSISITYLVMEEPFILYEYPILKEIKDCYGSTLRGMIRDILWWNIAYVDGKQHIPLFQE